LTRGEDPDGDAEQLVAAFGFVDVDLHRTVWTVEAEL
jgi:hypothetical protein